MNRTELLARLGPVLSRVHSAASDIELLMTAPEYDEDYKVERNGDLSLANLDRLHLAAVELSAATEALLGYGEDNRSDEEVADTVARTLLGLPLSPLEVTDDRTPEEKRLDGDDESLLELPP